jgi:hypothetical protein
MRKAIFALVIIALFSAPFIQAAEYSKLTADFYGIELSTVYVHVDTDNNDEKPEVMLASR